MKNCLRNQLLPSHAGSTACLACLLRLELLGKGRTGRRRLRSFRLSSLRAEGGGCSRLTSRSARPTCGVGSRRTPSASSCTARPVRCVPPRRRRRLRAAPGPRSAHGARARAARAARSPLTHLAASRARALPHALRLCLPPGSAEAPPQPPRRQPAQARRARARRRGAPRGGGGAAARALQAQPLCARREPPRSVRGAYARVRERARMRRIAAAPSPDAAAASAHPTRSLARSLT